MIIATNHCWLDCSIHSVNMFAELSTPTPTRMTPYICTAEASLSTITTTTISKQLLIECAQLGRSTSFIFLIVRGIFAADTMIKIISNITITTAHHRHQLHATTNNKISTRLTTKVTWNKKQNYHHPLKQDVPPPYRH